jgi:hypothetical protein
MFCTYSDICEPYEDISDALEIHVNKVEKIKEVNALSSEFKSSHVKQKFDHIISIVNPYEANEYPTIPLPSK